jgi:hypothetical protein
MVTAASNLFLGILQGSLIGCLKGEPGASGVDEADEENLEGCSPRSGEGSPDKKLRERRVGRSDRGVIAGQPVSVLRKGWRVLLQGVRDWSDAWFAVLTRWMSARAAGSEKKEREYAGGAGSVGGAKAQVGAVFGVSASVDRAARVLSPLLSGVLVQRYGARGLVLLTLCLSVYCSVLLQAYLPHASDVSLAVLMKVLRPQRSAHNKTS